MLYLLFFTWCFAAPLCPLYFFIHSLGISAVSLANTLGRSDNNRPRLLTVVPSTLYCCARRAARRSLTKVLLLPLVQRLT